jgi:signal transduction histidine kinase
MYAGSGIVRDVIFDLNNEMMISNLRGFVGGLRQTDRPRDDLLRALRRFAEEFAESYDIVVDVESNGFIDPTNRLAAEVIAIVHEGLSNIRKHTTAKHSAIRLDRTNAHGLAE